MNGSRKNENRLLFQYNKIHNLREWPVVYCRVCLCKI